MCVCVSHTHNKVGLHPDDKAHSDTETKNQLSWSWQRLTLALEACTENKRSSLEGREEELKQQVQSLQAHVC